MRAVVVAHRGEPGNLTEAPMPVPGEHDVLARVTVASINPIDWKTRDAYGRPLPFTLGQDFAGIVAGRGSAVRKYAEGERIFGIAREHGAYAEYTLIPEDDPQQPLAKIPDELGDADAAALPTAGLTALAAVSRLEVRKGERIFIVGVTGAVGQFAAQIARDRGAHVDGSGADKNAGVAESLVDVYVAYDRENVPDAIRKRYPEGIDAVLDLADDREGTVAMAAVLRPGGRIASTIRSIDADQMKARGLTGINVNLFEQPEASHAGLREIAQLVVSGRIRVPLVGQRDLHDAIQALELVKAGQINGKLVLSVESDEL